MLSWLLALCMLLSGLPWAPSVVAVESENIPDVAIENEDAPLNNETTIVEEDISLRGEYEKHYLMSDGSYQAVVYSYPVHELVDGAWAEIESTNQNARGSISTDTERTNIVDNYVLQGAGVQDRNRDRLYIGNRSAGLTRAYIRFATMPTLPAGSSITAATMTLHFTSGTSTAANASAYQVTGGQWASGEIQWSNKPAADILLQSNISHNNCTGYTFSCLTAVQHWYDGDTAGQNENYGIMLRYYDETVDDYNAVYSAEYDDESKRPNTYLKKYAYYNEYRAEESKHSLIARYRQSDNELVFFSLAGTRNMSGPLTEQEAKVLADAFVMEKYGSQFFEEYPHYVITHSQNNRRFTLAVVYQKYICGYPTTDEVIVKYNMNGELVALNAMTKGIFEDVESSITAEKIANAESTLLNAISVSWSIYYKELTLDVDGKCYLRAYAKRDNPNLFGEEVVEFYINID